MKLIVLMSTYNGEVYIREQLNSLINQDLRPDKILIRDDGSTDDTAAIIEEYASNYNFIDYYLGNNIGVYKSFFDLINNAEDSDYYALCDQDDVWHKDKLSIAIKQLEKESQDIPLLYMSRYTLTDENLKPLDSNVSNLYNFTDFAHSLIYHTAPGCTFVFNSKARNKIIEYDVNKEYCLIHDAIIHKVVAMFGKIILDKDSHMFYRQHGNNQIGMNTNIFRVFFGRVNRFLNGKMKNYRCKTAQSLLRVYGNQCNKEQYRLLNMLANYRDNSEYKKELLNEDSFKTNSINDFFFRFLVFTNYI